MPRNIWIEVHWRSSFIYSKNTNLIMIHIIITNYSIYHWIFIQIDKCFLHSRILQWKTRFNHKIIVLIIVRQINKWRIIFKWLTNDQNQRSLLSNFRIIFHQILVHQEHQEYSSTPQYRNKNKTQMQIHLLII